MEEELDLFFVVSGSRSRITGEKLHSSRFVLNIRKNLLKFRDAPKWSRPAHCPWKVFARLDDLMGICVLAVTPFYDEPSKGSETFLIS